MLHSLVGMGSAALAADVPYPGKATRSSHKGQWGTNNNNNKRKGGGDAGGGGGGGEIKRKEKGEIKIKIKSTMERGHHMDEWPPVLCFAPAPKFLRSRILRRLYKTQPRSHTHAKRSYTRFKDPVVTVFNDCILPPLLTVFKEGCPLLPDLVHTKWA